MVDNFQLSSSVLLERLKDLEQFKQQVEINQILPSLGLGDTADRNRISEMQKAYMPNQKTYPLKDRKQHRSCQRYVSFLKFELLF